MIMANITHCIVSKAFLTFGTPLYFEYNCVAININKIGDKIIAKLATITPGIPAIL